MAGKTLDELKVPDDFNIDHFCVKESVFPFIKFPNVDTILGPEMKSTGEVMGIDKDLKAAFAKAQIAAGNTLPNSGTAFISVKNDDKEKIVEVAKKLQLLDFDLVSTEGTHQYLKKNDINSSIVKKVKDGGNNILDLIKDDKIDLVINTTFSSNEILESFSIRRTSLVKQIPYFTTVAGAIAGVDAIEYLKNEEIKVKPLQDYF
jgi:carbamoyl-phosphate synthase large subunit